LTPAIIQIQWQNQGRHTGLSLQFNNVSAAARFNLLLTACQQIENIAMMSLASIEGDYQLATAAKAISPRSYAADTLKNFIFNHIASTT